MSENKTYRVIGLMSGTSLDGLDIVYVEFAENEGNWRYNILSTASISYSKQWSNKLADAINRSEKELDDLNLEYGVWLGEQVLDFIDLHRINVDLISSHGHTVFHEPEKGITQQIGQGQAIAGTTGIRTVCDFRKGDVMLGGQGAPLVPIGDKLLFPEYMACLNLGGIANISYEKNAQRIAFDIGMANMSLNYFARKIGLEYDKNGELAQSGTLNQALLDELNELKFFELSPPKSLGIEWFNRIMLPVLNSYEDSIENMLATLQEHQAFQIGKAITAIGFSGTVLATGGGVYNKPFLKRIRHHIKSKAIIAVPTNELIEFKEALIFALMGVLRIRNQVNCLKSVTGAREDSSAGRIFDLTD